MNRGLIYVLATAALATCAQITFADVTPPPVVPPTSVPEPDTISLFAVGAALVALVARRRRRK